VDLSSIGLSIKARCKIWVNYTEIIVDLMPELDILKLEV